MYRMDYDSHGAGDRTIAAKCEGSHSGGGCNFAQFIDFIQKKRINSKAKDAQGRWIFVGNFDPSKVPADLDLENPDINKASEIMDWYVTPSCGPSSVRLANMIPPYSGTVGRTPARDQAIHRISNTTEGMRRVTSWARRQLEEATTAPSWMDWPR